MIAADGGYCRIVSYINDIDTDSFTFKYFSLNHFSWCSFVWKFKFNPDIHIAGTVFSSFFSEQRDKGFHYYKNRTNLMRFLYKVTN